MKSYHLKWASHLPNMGEVFNTLYLSEGLADVTLACADGSVKAHKLILSTCSDYFLELFLESTSKRTVVVIPHIKVTDLRDLMVFIYTGEVNVNDESLSSLLEVADILGVRGLKYSKPPAEEEEDAEVEPGPVDLPADQPAQPIQAEEEEQEEGEDESVSMECKEESLSMEYVKTEMDPITIKTELNPDCPAEEAAMEVTEAKTVEPPRTTSESTVSVSIEQYTGSPSMSYGILSQTNQILNQISQEQMIPRPNQPILSSQPTHQQQHQQQHQQLSVYPTAVPGTAAPSIPAVSQSNPLVSMSNLAAMYQQSFSQPGAVNPTSPIKIKPKPLADTHLDDKDLNYYRSMAITGKPIDLLPEDINNIINHVSAPICPICNKDCANLPNLRSHLQVHNSIKPFGCTFCETKFARVSHLNRHIRTHTGERPFPCTLCDKSFARQDKLKVHMDRHNKEGGLSLMQASKKKKKEKSPIKSELDAQLPDQMNGHYNTNSLWNGFPMYENYQPVYPGMVNQYVPPLHNVMRIGECSIKPIGQ